MDPNRDSSGGDGVERDERDPRQDPAEIEGGSQSATGSAPPTEVTATIEDLEKNWQLLGQEDPLWAILSDPAKRGGGWQIDEFLKTGQREVKEIFDHLAELSLEPDRLRVLDFGCGVGRITHALAGFFERADGLDVSPAMIERAQALHRGIPNLFFHRSASSRLPFPDQAFDLVYSRLVLQHMGTAAALTYLAEFVRLLRPSGVAIVQAPSRRLIDEEFGASEIQLEGGSAMIEMNAHARDEVEDVIRNNGGRIVDVREDPCAGEFFESLKYTFTR